jgi:type II secretion system protein J
MRHLPRRPPAAFTLVELLSVLFVLSLLAVMSVRSLGVVLDSREQMAQDAEKWRGLALFFERFERDVHLAMPRAARQSGVALPAWQGIAGTAAQPRLEFNRFAAAAEMDGARRLAYVLNAQQQIELWLWPVADPAAGVVPVRHLLLGGVTRFELHYLNAAAVWVDTWPGTAADAAIPRAVRAHLWLASGEEVVRVFETGS